MSYASGVNAYADLQYRHISYKCTDRTTSGTALPMTVCNNLPFTKVRLLQPQNRAVMANQPQQLDIRLFSVAHKEPTRNNYTDGKFTEHPKAERLFDYELGYTLPILADFRRQSILHGLQRSTSWC